MFIGILIIKYENNKEINCKKIKKYRKKMY